MSTPKISVIVPVYNVEKWLHRCIDSILAQTFTDFELLLIDDGSTDASGAICDEYAARDSRIRVFHKPNGGVSSARNLGILESKGFFLINVDSDDYIDNNMLSEMLYAVKDNDILIADYYVEEINAEYIVSQYNTTTDNKQIVRKILNHELIGSLCNKLTKRSLYTPFLLEQIKGIDYCEDFLLIVQMLNAGAKVAFVPKAYYHYVQTSDSLTHQVSSKTAISIFKMLSKLETIEIVKDNCLKEYYLIALEFIGRLYAEKDLTEECLAKAPRIAISRIIRAVVQCAVYRRLRFFVLLKNLFGLKIARKIILKIKRS